MKTGEAQQQAPEPSFLLEPHCPRSRPTSQRPPPSTCGVGAPGWLWLRVGAQASNACRASGCRGSPQCEERNGESELQSRGPPGCGACERNGLSFFKPDSWCFLLTEDMQEMVGLGPSLGGPRPRVSPVSVRMKRLCLFACFNTGLCSVILGRGGSPRRPT